MNMNTLVSVVIPTKDRHDLVVRAVKSALDQTYRYVDVIVVVDGADSLTENALRDIDDDRLSVLVLRRSIGGSLARNAGVQAAKGDWVAFLDDDDEWLPDKLSTQFQLDISSHGKYPVICCKAYIACNQNYVREIWPRRLPRIDESASDYLLRRKTLFGGETAFMSSMILTKRELLLNVPFRNIKQHQDWDWLIRASNHPGFNLIYVDKPLLIYNDSYRPRLSTINGFTDWQYSLYWIDGLRNLISKQAYSSFLLTEVARRAAKDRSFLGLLATLKKAVLSGGATVYSVWSFLSICMINRELRTKIRILFKG
jgi:glycosyltransferase involved in cell wall biosynthesis